MNRRRLPPTLAGGRLRTSTAILAAVFLTVLAVYFGVRPPPETGPSSRAAQAERARDRARERPSGAPTPTPTRSPAPGSTTEPRRREEPEATPTAARTRTAEPEQRTPTASPEAPEETPPAGGDGSGGAEATPHGTP